MVLLDTHVWLWSAHGDVRRIGRRTRQLLSRAERQQSLCVSPASLLEVTALHTQGRVHLTRSPEHWIRESFDAGALRLVELSAAMAIDAGRIPRAALADPLDRLLVATARDLDATLLTSDEQILDYASTTDDLRVHDARL